MTLRRLLMVTVVVVLVFGVAGCDLIAKKAVEKTTGVDVDEDKITVKTPDGDVTLEEGDKGELPKGFPSDFPVYDGAEVKSSTRLQGESGVEFYVNLTSDDAFMDVYEWYKEALNSDGWTIESEMLFQEDGNSALIVGVKDKVNGTVSLSGEDGAVDIAFVVIDNE